MGKKGKKGRKEKNNEFNNKPQKGKDTITGLIFQIDNYGAIQSDTVYGPDSEFIRRINEDSGLPTQGDLWIELELGKDKIVITTKFIGNDDSFIEESYQRGVITGKFNYTNGILTRATLDGISGYNISFKDGEPYYESSYIERFPQPREVADPSAAPPWEYAIREEGAEVIFFAQQSKDFNTDQGNVLDILGYLGGRIYEAEYWKNPFEPNLI